MLATARPRKALAIRTGDMSPPSLFFQILANAGGMSGGNEPSLLSRWHRVPSTYPKSNRL